ncbi:hypothetical protein [Chthoniobacter flavus]|uniref:hypothetical protein n=1 Tax=Chthoniobacter flavus TaxID=191863 RepID=UPI003B42A19C
MAGAFLSQIGNVGPSLGQDYIVNAFMTVVVGGVGNLIGTVISALGHRGHRSKLATNPRQSGARQDPRARRHHPLPAMAPRGHFRHQEPEPGGMSRALTITPLFLR